MTKYEKIKELLIDEASENRLRHAYIFESSEPSLALDLSAFISKNILNSDNLDMVSDYHFIKQSDMNIQTIRNITKECIIQPFKDKKIYIFENGMNFTVPMQNAFLKTLEEPPEHVIFIIIIQNASYLLDTIRSRCITFFFDEDVQDLSEREDINLLTRELFDVLISKDKIKMIQYMDTFKKYKNDIDDVFTNILENSRNIMIAKESINLLPNKHKQNAYIHDIINKFTYYELLTIIDFAEQARRKLNSNCSFTMTIETMLFNMMGVKS